ncbi:helix-turn-helix domain-containing protein [Actinomadura luteofluorescens]|uniref:helix-turn-helix domain-containing protein n=1 Tax=Actinomadura luteofluorescens TaxID=46163 RepID=UPI003D9041CF
MPEMRTLPYDADKIRDLRERAGLSLVQLSERTDRHPESLRNIERNRKNASRVTLARIANALGVDLDDITLTEQEAEDAPLQVAS